MEIHESILMNLRKQAPWFGWIARMLLLGLLLDGCASTQSGTRPTLKQTQLRVSWAMTHYRNTTAFGGLTLAERQRIAAAYVEYQVAFNRALEAAGGDYDAPTPEDVKAWANEVNRVLAGMSLRD